MMNNTSCRNALDEAKEKVTKELLNFLSHGQAMDLNDHYRIFKDADQDKITIVKSSTWEEVCQVLELDNGNVQFET